jgi:hypothetical protein
MTGCPIATTDRSSDAATRRGAMRSLRHAYASRSSRPTDSTYLRRGACRVLTRRRPERNVTGGSPSGSTWRLSRRPAAPWLHRKTLVRAGALLGGCTSYAAPDTR